MGFLRTTIAPLILIVAPTLCDPSCDESSDCKLGTYCQTGYFYASCTSCSKLSDSCDEVGGDCCSAPFLARCPSAAKRRDPAGTGCVGPLMACDNPNKLQEIQTVYRFVHSICCEQVGDSCNPGDIGMPGNFDTSCRSPICRRAVVLASSSCSALLVSPAFPTSGPFKTMLDDASAGCHSDSGMLGGALDAPPRYPITTGGGATTVISANYLNGTELTDGMGAGGRHSNVVAGRGNVQIIQAGPGQVVRLVLKALWLAVHDALQITVDHGLPTTLSGHVLPPPEEGRSFTSTVGGQVEVHQVNSSSTDDGAKNAFLRHLTYCKRSFYQGRLGTNIGENRGKQGVLCRGRVLLLLLHRSCLRVRCRLQPATRNL
jgi:hypothetical protein